MSAKINQARVDTARTEINAVNAQWRDVKSQAENLWAEANVNNQPIIAEKCNRTIKLVNQVMAQNEDLLSDLRMFNGLSAEEQEQLLQKITRKLSSDQRELGKIDFGIIRKEQHYADLDAVNQSLQEAFEKTKKENEELRQQLAEAKTQLQKKDEIIKAKDQEIAIIKRDYTSLEDTANNLKSEISKEQKRAKATEDNFNQYKGEAEKLDEIKITNAIPKSECYQMYTRRNPPVSCARAYGLKIAYKVESNNPSINPRVIKPNKTGTVYILIQSPGEGYSNPLPSNYVIDATNEFEVPKNLLTKKGRYTFVIRRELDDERQLYSSSFTLNAI